MQNRCFQFTIENWNSSYRIPQRTVLGPPLFIVYTTPRSVICTASTLCWWYLVLLVSLCTRFFFQYYSPWTNYLWSSRLDVSQFFFSQCLENRVSFHRSSLTAQKVNSTMINLNGVILSPVTSARNLHVISDNNLSLILSIISFVHKSCFNHLRDLRRIRNTYWSLFCLYHFATSLTHSKVDNCKLTHFFKNLPWSQSNRFQLVFNAVALRTSAVTNLLNFIVYISNSEASSLAQN